MSKFHHFYVPEVFLLGDSQDEDRILLFGRGGYQEWAGHINHIFVDGTFSIAPPQYAQVKF